MTDKIHPHTCVTTTQNYKCSELLWENFSQHLLSSDNHRVDLVKYRWIPACIKMVPYNSRQLEVSFSCNHIFLQVTKHCSPRSGQPWKPVRNIAEDHWRSSQQRWNEIWKAVSIKQIINQSINQSAINISINQSINQLTRWFLAYIALLYNIVQCP